MALQEKTLSFPKDLEEHVELWVKEGIIDAGQKDRILARYELFKEAEQKAGPGKLIATVSVLGAILVGVGFILFIASNWSLLPKWGKLCIVFSSMFVSYGIGFYLRYEKESYPKVGASLILLGALIFGAGIFLTAQMYHITVHYPNGPLMWGLAVLPLAYLLKFKSLVSLAILDLLVWLGMEASLRLSYAHYGAALSMPVLFLMAGASLWGIGLMHRDWQALRVLSSPFVIIGSLVALSAQFFLSFGIFDMQDGSNDLMIFYLGAAVLLLLAATKRCLSEAKEPGWLPETLALFGLIVIAFCISSLHPQLSSAGYRGSFRLLFNIFFALEIVGLVVLGFIRQYPAYVNIGLLFFALDVIARYFDFFWALLPRSLFFIFGGLLLLTGGIMLEKKRRKILASFNIQEGEE
jgi:uncharacterized membrane protein